MKGSAPASRPVVVYDACVLFPAALRDLLLRIAATGLCKARWTDRILDEAFGSLLAARPDLDPARLAVTRRRMCRAIPECLVEGYEERISSLELPDTGDRHVLAAAIHCGAEAIITENVQHFPDKALESHGLKALTSDDWVLGLITSAQEVIVDVVRRQAGGLKNPPLTVEMLLERLARQGLGRSVDRLRQLFRERRASRVSAPSR